MKLPLQPPDLAHALLKLKPEVVARVLQNQSPLINGEYLHWDDVRHRTPPEGLSSEDWWLAIKLARQGMLRPLPLLDKAGRPLVFGTPEPVLIHLHHIDRDAAGEIRSAGGMAAKEHQRRYLVNSLIEEAITSSQLEGASTTRRVAEAMLREGRKPRDHSERMIFNNFSAMQAIRTLCDAPIAPARILELHRMLTADTLDDPQDAGRLRRSDDVRVVDNRDGGLLHQPPPFRELPERLERLCQFANAAEDSVPFVHPVLRAALLHFMIGYDHPFADGNGRTARVLFYWSMARSGYWLMEFLSISNFLRRAPAQYVLAYLHSETDGGDTTYFLLHQLEIIRCAIGSLHDYLARTIEAQHATELMLASSPALRERLNHRQIDLLTHALKHPGENYRVEGHQRTHGVVYQTARTDLLTLAGQGLLTKSRAGRAFVFRAPADLQRRIAELATDGQGSGRQ